MYKNNVRYYREKHNYTQTELAEKAGLSLRTIQRIESGNAILKGYTLNALVKALEIDNVALLKPQQPETIDNKDDVLRIKLINLSALSFIGVPFGNLIIPIFLWLKYRNVDIVDKLGRRIINFQIIWSVVVYLMLIISPFLQKSLSLNFSLILYFGIFAACLNIFVIAKTAIAVGKNEFNTLNLPFHIL